MYLYLDQFHLPGRFGSAKMNFHVQSIVNDTGFPHKRENGKSPGIRYWSFKAMKSPGISTFGALSRELSGKICSLAHPQRHSYAWMLNLVYQLFFRKKTAQS